MPPDTDLRDVALLAQQSLITHDALDAAMREILPQLRHDRFFNVNPQRFSEQYAATTASDVVRAIVTVQS